MNATLDQFFKEYPVLRKMGTFIWLKVYIEQEFKSEYHDNGDHIYLSELYMKIDKIKFVFNIDEQLEKIQLKFKLKRALDATRT